MFFWIWIASPLYFGRMHFSLCYSFIDPSSSSRTTSGITCIRSTPTPTLQQAQHHVRLQNLEMRHGKTKWQIIYSGRKIIQKFLRLLCWDYIPKTTTFRLETLYTALWRASKELVIHGIFCKRSKVLFFLILQQHNQEMCECKGWRRRCIHGKRNNKRYPQVNPCSWIKGQKQWEKRELRTGYFVTKFILARLNIL